MLPFSLLLLGSVLAVSGTIGRISAPPPLNSRTHYPPIQPAAPLSPSSRPSSPTSRTAAAPLPGTAGFQPIRNEPSSTQNYPGLNLTFVISGSDIPKKGKINNKLESYIKVYYKNATVSEPIKFATTETVSKTASPEFITVVTFLWKRGEGQQLVFKVKEKGTFSDDTLGETVVDVDDYVMNKNQKANVSLSNGGSLLIQRTTPISFQLYARNLPSMDTIGLSDPFVICYWKRGQTGTEHKFYQTKHINDVQNPDWNETINFENYIKGTDLWFVFKVKDYDSVTSADDLGQALVEVDPYATARQTKIVRIGTSGQATLALTPV